MNSLSEINGLEWIRLHYAYPAGYPDEILPIIKEKSNICNYIDIPIQHINNRILSLMQRAHSSTETIKLLEKIRKELPDAAIRTTLIVGFPGETDAEFEELVNFVREFKFERLGVFAYSPEEGTKAYKLEDNVPEEVKQQRLETIMSVQQEVSLSVNEKRIGKVYKTIIDRKEGEYFIGRTEFDSPEIDNEVLINANGQELSIGKFYLILISKADYFDLFGTLSQI